MSDNTRLPGNFLLALTLALGSGAVAAKGPGTLMTPGDAGVSQQCYPVSGSAGATAKSPGSNRTYACAPAGPGSTALTAGATTSKAPQRIDGPHEARVTAAGLGCTGRC